MGTQSGDDYFTKVLKSEQLKADWLNRSQGNLQDGFDCPKCKNRGYFYRAEMYEYGGVHLCGFECDCMQRRRNIRRMRASGLENTIREHTFANYSRDEEWQQTVYDFAKEYIHTQNAWWYIGGVPGCGKTHICTAIAGQIMRTNDLLYMRWVDESAKIKSLVSDAPAYEDAIAPLKKIDVLYIDDFLKPVRGSAPTDADIRLAYEILNARYASKKRTIISSERLATDLYDIDAAIAGRIIERSGKYIFSLTAPIMDRRVKRG